MFLNVFNTFTSYWYGLVTCINLFQNLKNLKMKKMISLIIVFKSYFLIFLWIHLIFLKINAKYQTYEVITANVYCHIIPRDFISVLRLSEDQDSGGLLLLCMWGPPAQRRPRQNLCRHGAGHDWRHQVRQRHHLSLIQSYKLINCFSDVMRIFPHMWILHYNRWRLMMDCRIWIKEEP